MMGRQQCDQGKLFCDHRLDDRIPKHHLLRRMNVFVTAALADLHAELEPHYSDIGRPSVDPELMIRRLLVGYLYGIRSERRLCQEVERLWREEGLQLPHRHTKRKRLYHHDASVIRLRPKYPNHIWSIDFVHDRPINGRPYKMLTLLDEFTREALCVSVAVKMGSAEVLDALYPLLLRRGTPAYIRSDNGPEFAAASFQDWLGRVGIQPIRIYPSSPWENGYNECLSPPKLGHHVATDERSRRWPGS
jgi:transposase InsO family protein